MFAIIKTGGKQYKVKEGDELSIELLELGKSKTLKLDQVLLVSKDSKVELGRPFLKGAYCEAELIKEYRGPKSFSFKYILFNSAIPSSFFLTATQPTKPFSFSNKKMPQFLEAFSGGLLIDLIFDNFCSR